MIILKKYRLRWVFEFMNKKPIYGIWDNGSPHLSDSAWIKDKTGLKYAVIEGEELHSWGQYRFLECSADRFVTFKWVASVSMPSNMQGSFSSQGDIVGLQLVTEDHSFTIFVDGKFIKKELNKDDKKFDIKEYQTRVI